MILCLKFYVEQACSFDICKYYSDLSVSEILNEKPKFQPRYAYKLYAYKIWVYEMWKKVIDFYEN